MKKIVLSLCLPIVGCAWVQLHAQTTVMVFDEVLFYDGYAPLVDENDLYEPVPPEVLRHSNSRYARKLTDTELNALENTLDIEVALKAACDNYDRLGHVFLAFVDKGETTYDVGDVERIEIARFITPFMNKNIMPDTVPFDFKADNVVEILTDQDLRTDYDIWVELEVFGVPYAAQNEVAGCENRIDTFYGTLNFISDDDPNISYSDDMVFLPLAAQMSMNNYNATDVAGETTRIIDFELTDTVENAKLYLITSNHGAYGDSQQGSVGEEYNRRWHYVYLDNSLVLQYLPGGKSCEPYRQYNTQGNGIYSASPRPLRHWIDWNNWCPADAVPTREIELGTLTPGQYSFKIDVPEALFIGQNGPGTDGNIPLSVYLHNRNSGNPVTCTMPYDLIKDTTTSSEISIDWVANGMAEKWEILYGKSNSLTEENYTDAHNDGNTGGTITSLAPNTYYDIHVRSKCDGADSGWTRRIQVRTEQTVSVAENERERLRIYPNPVEDMLYLGSGEIAIDQVSIHDLSGKHILSKEPVRKKVSLDLSGLTSGVYFIKVRISGKMNVYKIVKH